VTSAEGTTRIQQLQGPGKSEGDLPPESWPRSALWLTVGTAIALGVVLFYEGIHLGYFHGLNGPDDGIYYGEGVMLAHGILPYRSYIEVQPPGMALLMAPFGLVGRWTNDRTGFELARIFIVFVSMANIGLLGRLIRRRHWAGVLVGVVILGFYLDSISADHTVLLEPLLVFGTLLGLLIVFDDTEHATTAPTRWLVAGVILGLTTSIKLWGIIPLLVLAAIAVIRGRRCFVHFLGGAAAVLLILIGPFLLLAPSALIREVLIVQVTRSHAGYASEEFRLMNLLNAPGHAFGNTICLPIMLWVLVACIVVASIVLQNRLDPVGVTTNLDIASMVCLVMVAASFLVAAEFDSHYGGFLAPFLALVLSATATRLVTIGGTAMTVAMAAASIALFLLAVQLVGTDAKEQLPTSALVHTFPPTACIVSTSYGPLILANRYNLTKQDCPHVLDVYGTELTDGGGVALGASDASSPKLQVDWLNWLHHSDGLVLTSPSLTDTGIGQSAQTYLRSHFSLRSVSNGLYIYSRSGS